jgi:cytochrome c oxidase cbb3-type subunit 3
MSLIHSLSAQSGRLKKILLLSAGLCCGTLLQAQAPLPDAMNDPFVVVMIVIMAILALIIGLLAWVVLGSAQIYLQKAKQEEAAAKEKKSQPATTAATVVVLLLTGLSSRAEETGNNTAVVNAHNLSDTAFYTMTGVIFLELVVIAALLYNLRVLLEIKKKKKAVLVGQPAKPAVNWWDKLNKFKPVEQEISIDLGHDYDGIRELDNRLPPWWLYGFYLTIIFAGIYLWRHHVSHTAPLSGEEYQLAVQEAEVKRAEYLKKAANNVDENTVKYLTGPEDLAAGQKIYAGTCFPCHGKQGEGGVGPNLTDDYWLHGGSMKDIFKTIRYGVAEKGMKSWKDDYSPAQIAQLASYIKSIKGANPPNAKPPQGTLFQEDSTATADSTRFSKS